MKKVLLVAPYNLTRKEVGGAFTYQFCERLSDTCSLDVIIYQYKDDDLDKPDKQNLNVICVQQINIINKLISWLQKPKYHPLFTSRYSGKMIRFMRKKIEENAYDYVVFDYSQTFAMAQQIKHPHKLLICHDVIYQRFEREGSKLLAWIKRSEGSLIKDAERVFAFSEKDCQLIKDLYGVACEFTPVFIKQTILETYPSECGDYHVFFADWGRHDNSESLEWFLNKVAPTLTRTVFKVIGGGLSKEIKNKIEGFSNIDYLGFVDNPYPIIANAMSQICPLHTGAGIKVKCLESLACGTPIIGTDVAFEGIDGIFGEYLIKAETPEEYIEKISKANHSLADKIEIKNRFVSNYSQKSIINYITR